jgi:hypothetical protein
MEASQSHIDRHITCLSAPQNKPVEEWPLCDYLLSWFSDGFPLEKAQAYIALRRVPTMNDLDKQVGD